MTNRNNVIPIELRVDYAYGIYFFLQATSSFVIIFLYEFLVHDGNLGALLFFAKVTEAIRFPNTPVRLEYALIRRSVQTQRHSQYGCINIYGIYSYLALQVNSWLSDTPLSALLGFHDWLTTRVYHMPSQFGRNLYGRAITGVPINTSHYLRTDALNRFIW